MESFILVRGKTEAQTFGFRVVTLFAHSSRERRTGVVAYNNGESRHASCIVWRDEKGVESYSGKHPGSTRVAALGEDDPPSAFVDHFEDSAHSALGEPKVPIAEYQIRLPDLTRFSSRCSALGRSISGMRV